MWMLPLYLHVNQKSDYDYDDDDDQDYAPFLSYGPLKKNMDEIFSAKYLKKLLKLEP